MPPSLTHASVCAGWTPKEVKDVLLTRGNNPNIVLWPTTTGAGADGWIALGETLPHLCV